MRVSFLKQGLEKKGVNENIIFFLQLVMVIE